MGEPAAKPSKSIGKSVGESAGESDKKFVVPAELATRTVPVHKVGQGVVTADDDCVAVEEPLEISLSWPAEAEQAPVSRTVAVTMRTPGHDEELALGFLFTEGVIASQEEVATVTGASSARRL